MWYFAWVLGFGLACAFAILNALWHELHVTDMEREEERRLDAQPPK